MITTLIDSIFEADSLAGDQVKSNFRRLPNDDTEQSSMRQQRQQQRQMVVDLITAEMIGSFKGFNKNRKKGEFAAPDITYSSSVVSEDDYSAALPFTKHTATASLVGRDKLHREGLVSLCDSSDVESVWTNDDTSDGDYSIGLQSMIHAASASVTETTMTDYCSDCDYSIALQSHKNTACASVKESPEQYLQRVMVMTKKGCGDFFSDVTSFGNSVATNDVHSINFSDDLEDVSTASSASNLTNEVQCIKANLLRVDSGDDSNSSSAHELREVIIMSPTKEAQIRGSIISSDGNQSVISIDEIKQSVLRALPDHIKNSIPSDAWDKIFQDAVSGSSQSDDSGSDDLNDDYSVLSDITGATGLHIPASQNLSRPLHLQTTASSSQKEHTESEVIDEATTKVINQLESSNILPTSNINVPPGKQSFVAFDSVHVRYYEPAIDINPSVSSGPAVGLSWKVHNEVKTSVNTWQAEREGKIRRNKELLIPRRVRQGMLIDLGYTQKDIAKATRSIVAAKNQRRQTIQNLKYESLEERVEKAVRTILKFGRKKGDRP
jgi:hypothetical protein